MKTSSEKEKKLDTALSKLTNLNLNANLKENLQHLSYQKNQLEIEKKEISNKYEELIQEHKKIKKELKNNKKKKKRNNLRYYSFLKK